MQNEFCQRITCFRQKNRGTKDSLNVQMSVQAGLTYLCSFNVCTFGTVSATIFYCIRTEGYFFCFFKNVVLCTYKLCLYDECLAETAWACSCKSCLMFIIMHSYVLVFLCLYYFMFRALAGIVPSLRSDPWSRPGMTASLVLAMFCGCLGVWGRM